jgi:hypothetical protein
MEDRFSITVAKKRIVNLNIYLILVGNGKGERTSPYYWDHLEYPPEECSIEETNEEKSILKKDIDYLYISIKKYKNNCDEIHKKLIEIADGKSHTYNELTKMNVEQIDKLQYFIESLNSLEIIRQPYYLFNVIFKQALFISDKLNIKDRFSTSNEFSSVEGCCQSNYIEKIKIKEHYETGLLIREQSIGGQLKKVTDGRTGVILVPEKSRNDPNDTIKKNEIQKKRHNSSFNALFQGIKKSGKTKIGKVNDYYMKKLGLNIQTTAYDILEALKQEYNKEERPRLHGHLFRLFCTTMSPFKNKALYDDILEIIKPSFPDKIQCNISTLLQESQKLAEICYYELPNEYIDVRIDELNHFKALSDCDNIDKAIDKQIEELNDEVSKCKKNKKLLEKTISTLKDLMIEE